MQDYQEVTKKKRNKKQNKSNLYVFFFPWPVCHFPISYSHQQQQELHRLHLLSSFFLSFVKISRKSKNCLYNSFSSLARRGGGIYRFFVLTILARRFVCVCVCVKFPFLPSFLHSCSFISYHIILHLRRIFIATFVRSLVFLLPFGLNAWSGVGIRPRPHLDSCRGFFLSSSALTALYCGGVRSSGYFFYTSTGLARYIPSLSTQRQAILC